MEDFFYFLSEYPFIAVLIVFFLYRMFSGSDEKTKQKRAEQKEKQALMKQARREQAATANSAKQARAGDALSGEGIIEQIQRHLEDASRQAANELRGQISTSSSTSDLSLSRPEIRMSGPTDEETASMELARREEKFNESTAAMARRVEESTVDHDLNTGAFDSWSTEPTDRKEENRRWHMTTQTAADDPFAFNLAGRKSDSVAYSTRQRHYVSAARIDAPTVDVRENQTGRAAIVVKDLLADSDALTRAFILQEVLGPPRGRRFGGSGRTGPR